MGPSILLYYEIDSRNDVRKLHTAVSCPYAPTELLVAVYTATIAATNMQVCAQVLACSAAEI